MMRWINRKVGAFSGLLVALIAIDLVVGFVSRAAGNPVFGVTELAQFSMVVIIFLGQSLCEERRAHVRVEVLIFHLPTFWWNLANLFTYVVALIGTCLMTWGAFLEARFSYISEEATSGLVLIPLYPVKFAIVVGFGLYAIQVLLNLIEQIRHPMPKPAGLDEELDQVDGAPCV